MRKATVPVLILTVLLLNPMVVAVLLTPAARAAGPAAEAFVERNLVWFVVVSGGYFLVALTTLVSVWTSRRRTRALARRAARAVPGTPYRGPGGGKRPPHPPQRRGHRGRR